MGLLATDGIRAMRTALDAAALMRIWREARDSLPRGETTAVISAFLSEVAATDFEGYPPLLGPE